MRIGERGRKFLREVGSVVLGVVIALGLGAIATDIGWRIDVANARDSLSVELGEAVGQVAERQRVSPCVQRRLDRMSAIIDGAAESGRLPAVGEIGAPPFRTWTRGVWDSIVSAQTAAHFGRDDLDNFSGAYEFMSILNRTNARELDQWTRLQSITGPGRPFSAAEAADMRATIAEARVIDRLITVSGIRLHQMLDAFALAYDRGSADQHANRRGNDPICQPIGRAAPPSYGAAPLAGEIERALANPIVRDGD